MGRWSVAGAGGLAWVVASVVGAPLHAEEATLDPFLIPVAKEAALARSAAPGEIAGNADLWLLGREGYERVSIGTNGFACLVERSWGDPTVLAPICYNPLAVAAVLPVRLREARMASEGVQAAEIRTTVARGYAQGRFRAPPAGAFAYMMSEGQWLGRAGQAFPHVMIYAPYLTNEEAGGNPAGSVLPSVLEAAGSPAAIMTVGTTDFVPLPVSPPAADPLPVGDSERQALLRLIEDNERRFRAVFLDLTAEEWTRRPDPEGWSPAELVEHVAAADGAMLAALGAALEGAGAGAAFRTVHPDELMRYRLTDRGERVKTVPAMVPNGRFGDASGAVAAFGETRTAFRRTVGELTPAARRVSFPHVFFPEGEVDGYQWLLIASGHADRHFEQLQEIVEQLRYVESHQQTGPAGR